jgi:hypothetical protein
LEKSTAVSLLRQQIVRAVEVLGLGDGEPVVTVAVGGDGLSELLAAGLDAVWTSTLLGSSLIWLVPSCKAGHNQGLVLVPVFISVTMLTCPGRAASLR